MPDISDLIGERFEEFFRRRFPGFEDHREDRMKTPDFYNPKYGFWVEAKAGNARWGVRLKREQVEKFERILEPVVYCCGLHDFTDANARLAGKSEDEIRDILKRELNIVQAYFAARKVIARVWDIDSRLNSRGTIEYCMMKGHIFRDILLNRKCQRKGVRVEQARTHYGLTEDEFNFHSMAQAPARGFVYGTILAKAEERVIAYLRDNSVLVK